MNKKNVTIVLLLALIFNGLTSLAWGPKGHDIVAAIAEQNLTCKTRKNIKKLLDKKSIIYYSSWMDNLQNSPNWKDGYDKTKTWHYANVDEGHTYETMPKNEKGDVVQALIMITDEMTNNDKLTDSMRVDYLKMIVHLVGDLHCPMHAGRLSDRGGNNVKVRWFGQVTNLHSVWDTKLIDSARKWSYTEWVYHLDRQNRKYKKAAIQGGYEDWFAETVNSATEIYDYLDRLDKENPNLSYQYVYDFSPLLEERLLIAGYRLAHVLNSLF